MRRYGGIGKLKGKKCECPDEGISPIIPSLYDQKTELPYVVHKPGKCRCKNDLKLYERDGIRHWLCSNCVREGYREVKK